MTHIGRLSSLPYSLVAWASLDLEIASRQRPSAPGKSQSVSRAMDRIIRTSASRSIQGRVKPLLCCYIYDRPRIQVLSDLGHHSKVGKDSLVRRGPSNFQNASCAFYAGLPLSLLNSRAWNAFGSYIELGTVELANLLPGMSCKTKGSYEDRFSQYRLGIRPALYMVI